MTNIPDWADMMAATIINESVGPNAHKLIAARLRLVKATGVTAGVELMASALDLPVMDKRQEASSHFRSALKALTADQQGSTS